MKNHEITDTTNIQPMASVTSFPGSRAPKTPKSEMNVVPITILVPMSHILEQVKRGKVTREWEEDLGRYTYEAPFEFSSFLGYPVDVADEDEIHQALVAEHTDGGDAA